MHMFDRVTYSQLNARQQENFNFHKIASRLADYGFNSLRLTDDWQGADFIACHLDGETFLKVQLKSRMTIQTKYLGKEIHIAFLQGEDRYIYPHDAMVQRILENNPHVGQTRSWREEGQYHWLNPPAWARAILDEYRI